MSGATFGLYDGGAYRCQIGFGGSQILGGIGSASAMLAGGYALEGSATAVAALGNVLERLASLVALARVAGTRSQIESGFEAVKGECGLDEYEVRK